MTTNKNRLQATTSILGSMVTGSASGLVCFAIAANALMARPAYAAFTETNFGDTQTALAANAVCAEQLDDVIFGLQTAEIAADFIGLGAEAAGAVFIISEIPGIVAQAAALALGTAAFALEQQAGDKPNCEGDFLGSVTAGGGGSFGGDSIFNATLDVTGPLNANGGINVTGVIVGNSGANITGNSIFNNQLTVTGPFIANGGATITGGIDVTGNSAFHNNVQIDGDLNVDGAGTFGTIAVDKGLSVHGGNIWLGNTDGTTFQPGISIGGGAFAGAGGVANPPSTTGHAAAIAIGNGANAAVSGSIAFGLSAASTAVNAIAIGTSAGAAGGGANSTAVGSLARAVGINGSAFGTNSSAGGLDSVAFGNTANASAQLALAAGASSVASGASSVAVGDRSRATMSGAIAVGQSSAATGVDAIAIGRGATATGSVAVGAGAMASNGGAAFGDLSSATGLNSTAVGPNAAASFANSVAVGSNSIAAVENTVSFGSPGFERRLMNVNDGILNTDAPNMGQLRHAVEKLNRGVASTIAMSTPILDLEPGETSVAMGGGFYQGENGVAIRGAYRPHTEWPMLVSGAVATAGNDSVTGQVGLAFKF